MHGDKDVGWVNSTDTRMRLIGHRYRIFLRNIIFDPSLMNAEVMGQSAGMFSNKCHAGGSNRISILTY
ncbi:MAG: hypothetical protein CO189_01470 [candidate division Zixibacteria bacterium CG_4_9_14_3_um_filter_46_8]|nr:MAG: hypothetical protein CO189_01470 [candidate division Zixibacteria bacterium CG_4_9_14_3_um_filter_46_8]